MTLAIVVEGDTDLPVARKLAADAGLSPHVEIDCGGKGALDANLGGYSDAAKGSPWLVLRDLDHDAPCAAELVRVRSPRPSEWLVFRIAVREVESWLLADALAISTFLGIAARDVPADPDAEDDPTRTLVNLARRSPRASVRRSLVPKPGAHTQVGPLYEALIFEFGRDRWSLDRACKRSDSLSSARRALREVAAEWREHVLGTGLRRRSSKSRGPR